MKALIWYECKLGTSGEGREFCWDLKACDIDIIPPVGTTIEIEHTGKTGVVEALQWRLVMDEVDYMILDIILSTITPQKDTTNYWLGKFDKRGGAE